MDFLVIFLMGLFIGLVIGKFFSRHSDIEHILLFLEELSDKKDVT